MLTEWSMAKFFDEIDLRNKSVLDIGCGNGALGHYVLSRSARRVTGLEPMLDGSHEYKVPLWVDPLALIGLDILPIRIQDFAAQDKFDLVVMYDSINHLDEEACAELEQHTLGWAKYLAIFKELYGMINSGGKVVIADASRRNLFADLGTRNIFDRSIEWHKHQTPELWAKLLGCCGFVNPKIDWLTPWQLRRLDWLIRNRFVSYFLVSHFRLVMSKGGNKND